MSARSFWNAKSSRTRPNKARRKYKPGVEGLETLQLMSLFGDVGNFFQGVGNDVVNLGNQAVSDIETYGQEAISTITSGAEQAIGAIQNFGGQLLTAAANDVQMVESTVTSSLGQIGTAIGNFLPQAAGAVTGAIGQLGNVISSDISQVTGQVSSDLKSFVSDVETGAQTAQNDLSTAFNTASSAFTSGFEEFGTQLQATVTSPSFQAALSYELDGLMIIGGVALMASEAFDGPVGAMGGATLIGAGIQGIEYNVENTNSDGSVNGNWSWSGYGENLGIGAATGFVSGGLGVIGDAAGGGILAGAATGAATGVFDQFLTNAANGKAPGTNLGAAAVLGGAGGALFGGLSNLAGKEAGNFAGTASGDLVGGAETALGDAVMSGGDAASSFDQSFDELAMEAGVDTQDAPTAIPLPDGETQTAIPVPDETPAPVMDALPGGLSKGEKLALKTVLKDSLRTFAAPQVSGIASSELSQLKTLLGIGSNTPPNSTPPPPLQLANDLTAYFNAASASAPNGYLQSVTSVVLYGNQTANGTALVGIGGDNAIYVNEQIPGIGSTGWVNLGGPYKSIAVTSTGIDGLPAIFAIGFDNGVHFNQQNPNGSWNGWDTLNIGGAITFKSISATLSPVNTPAVFAIGSDNSLYAQWVNADGSWSGWNDQGGYVTQISATAVPGVGTGVFAVGAYNQAFFDEYALNGGWSGWTDLGGYVKQVAASLTIYDNPEVFAIGSDNAVYTKSESNGTWNGWTDLGGYAKSIVTEPNTIATVYTIDASNNIEVDKYTVTGGDFNRVTTWTGFQNLGGPYKEVTVAGTVYGLGPDNHLYALHPGSTSTDVGGYVASMAIGGNAVDVGIGSDHSVYVDQQNANGSWTGAMDLGGDLLSVTGTKTPNGETALFGIGSDDQAYVNEQNVYGQWIGWIPIGGNVVHTQSIVATTGPTGKPEVFVVGNDNAVWVDQQTSDSVFTWTGFTSLGGQVKSIVVAQDPSGGAVVATVNLDNGVCVNEQRADGSFAGWAGTGGYVKSLAAAQAPDGGVALVAIGEDNAVWVDEQSISASEADYGSIDGSWTGFTRLGGDFTSVTAVNSGFGTLEIYAINSSGNEWFDSQPTNHQWGVLTMIASPSTTSSSMTS